MNRPFVSASLNLTTTLFATAARTVFDDYPSAFTPQLWANESIAILNRGL